MKLSVISMFAAALLIGTAHGQQLSRDQLWSKGDPESVKALAQLYAEDADVIFFTGEARKGRDGIEKGLAEWIATSKAASGGDETSIQSTAVSGYQISDDVVLWDSVFQIFGPPRDGSLPTRFFGVSLMRREDAWPIVACTRYSVPANWKASDGPAVSVEGGMSEPKAVAEAKTVLETYTEAYNSQDIDAVVSLFAPDAVAASSGTGVRRVGQRIRFWYSYFHFNRNPRRIVQVNVQSARFLTPDVLIVDSAIEIEHLNREEDNNTTNQIFAVFAKTDAGWKIKWLHHWQPYTAQGT